MRSVREDSGVKAFEFQLALGIQTESGLDSAAGRLGVLVPLKEVLLLIQGCLCCRTGRSPADDAWCQGPVWRKGSVAAMATQPEHVFGVCRGLMV